MNYKLNLPNFKEINGVIYKLCTKCKKYKPMTNEYFPKRTNVKCGYDSYCKECYKEKDKFRIRISAFDDEGRLYCMCCKQYKPISDFYKGDKNIKRKNYSRECKECESKRKKIARASSYIKDKAQFLKHLLYGCKTRALRRGIPYNLDLKFLVDLFDSQNGRCAISNIPMLTVRKSGKNIYNASIDRIVPHLGYVKDNVRLVCNHVNMMRSNLEDEQLIEFCKAIVNHNELRKNKYISRDIEKRK